MNKKPLSGWTMYIDEVSNGVFKVKLIDTYGRVAEVIGDATEGTISKAIRDAFDIEKQVSQNWHLFLYEFAIQTLSAKNITAKDYDEKDFGSWYIQIENNRLAYDGKDSFLIFQTQTKGNWVDVEITEKDELNYSNFLRKIDSFIGDTLNDVK